MNDKRLTPKTDRDSQIVACRARGTALTILALLLSGLLIYRAWIARQAPLGRTPVATRLNPNLATADQLAQLPGVGPALADRIIAHRERRAAGPNRVPAFRSEADLLAVRGVGPRKLRVMRAYIEFGPGEPAGDVRNRGD